MQSGLGQGLGRRTSVLSVLTRAFHRQDSAKDLGE